MPPNVGDLIADKYRLGRELGAGGYGVVFAATHVALQNQVAIKFLAAATDPTTRKRFVREARACVKLHSEHVARVMDVGEAGRPYIVMEFLEGLDLRQHAYKHGSAPLPIADVCEFLVHACHGLAEAHSHGIVHRDMKPANLFLTRDAHGLPVVKVLDFGISKVARGVSSDASEQSQVSMTAGVILGTPQYMSPEQIASTSRVDHRTDIWSLGITLYELLSRTLPFHAPALMDVMTKVTYETPARIETLRKDVPRGVGDIIERCLSKTADKRFSTCAELAKALQPFAHARATAIVEKVALLPPPAEALSSGSGSNPVVDGFVPFVPPRPAVMAANALLRDQGFVSLLGAAPPPAPPTEETLIKDPRATATAAAAAAPAATPSVVIREESVTTVPFRRPPDAVPADAPTMIVTNPVKSKAESGDPAPLMMASAWTEPVHKSASTTSSSTKRQQVWFVGAAAGLVMALVFAWLFNRSPPAASSVHAAAMATATDTGVVVPPPIPSASSSSTSVVVMVPTTPDPTPPSSLSAVSPAVTESSSTKARPVMSARPSTSHVIAATAVTTPRRPGTRTTASTTPRGPSEYPPTRD